MYKRAIGLGFSALLFLLIVLWEGVGHVFAQPAPGTAPAAEEPASKLKPVSYDWPHDGKILALAFSEDGKKAVSVNTEGLVKEWDIATGQMLRSIPHDMKIIAAAFHESSKVGLARTWDGQNAILTRDLETGEARETLSSHGRGITALAFSPDGDYILSGGQDHHVMLWGTAYGELIGVFQGHDDTVHAVVPSPDQERIASIAADKSIRLWNISNSETVLSFKPHKKGVSTLAFSPDGEFLVSGGQDKIKPALVYSVALWDLSKKKWWQFSKKPVRSLGEHDAEITMTLFSPDGKAVLVADRAGNLSVVDMISGKPIQILESDQKDVATGAFSFDGRLVLSAGSGKVLLWNISKDPVLVRGATSAPTTEPGTKQKGKAKGRRKR